MKKPKWKGKKWYDLIAPKFLGEQVMGKTPASDPSLLNGRVVKISLPNLLETSKYYFKIKLQISSIKDERAYTKFVGHDCSQDFIARMIRRYGKRVDSRVIVQTRDRKNLIIKTISITLHRVSTSIKDAVRAAIDESVKSAVKRMDMEKFVLEMIKGSLQEKIKQNVSRIYPLRELEIRKTEVVEQK
jgi:small subunit ribosomal protein S3Ae